MPITAIEAGALIVTKPVNLLLFEQIVKVGMACRNRLMMYKEQTARLQTRYEELKVIDRAKCLLIEHMRITEEEAHRVIEKEAMDSRMSRVRVAKKVLDRFDIVIRTLYQILADFREGLYFFARSRQSRGETPRRPVRSGRPGPSPPGACLAGRGTVRCSPL